MSAHAAAAFSAPPIGLRRASDLDRSVGADALAVAPTAAPVLPWPGLRRGTVLTLSANSGGLTSLLLSVLAGPTGADSWCALVGAPSLSPSAARRAGVDLARLALVPDPGGRVEAVVSALLDGMDVVAVDLACAITPGHVARLAAKARRRNCVLLPFGRGAGEWSNATASLTVEAVRWHGLTRGRGLLRHCELDVSTRYRGRKRMTTMWPYGEPVSARSTPTGTRSVVNLADRRANGRREQRKGNPVGTRHRRPVS